MLCKMGVSCHPLTVASKLRELGKDHDQELLKWKKTLEWDDEIKKGTEMLKAEVDSLTYLPELPSAVEFKAYVEELKCDSLSTSPTGPTTCTSSDALTQSSMSTLDTSCLNLTFNSEPKSVVRNICSKLLDNGISHNGLIDCLEQMIHPSQSLGKPCGYQIIGDNCDLHVNVRHVTNDSKNESFHWFNCVAFKDQVSGDHLSDIHETTLDDVPVSSFFPDNEDIQELKSDFMILWSRAIVNHLSSFAFLRNAVVYHIPHQYSDVMRCPVPQVSDGNYTVVCVLYVLF